jgi:hypothetical protein
LKLERPDWKGRTVVCIASGPSLTELDCIAVRLSWHPTIVTNLTGFMCPWADVCFGFDSNFWKLHARDLLEFSGTRASMSPACKQFGVRTVYMVEWFQRSGNGGSCAISLALAGLPKRIVLLGYDCQKTDGRTHWHGDHAPGLSNCASLKTWPGQFREIAKLALHLGIPVLNASRETSLNCFPRVDLEEALA